MRTVLEISQVHGSSCLAGSTLAILTRSRTNTAVFLNTNYYKSVLISVLLPVRHLHLYAELTLIVTSSSAIAERPRCRVG